MRKYFLKSCAGLLLSLLLVNFAWAGIDIDGGDDAITFSNYFITTVNNFTFYFLLYWEGSSATDQTIAINGDSGSDGFTFYLENADDTLHILYGGMTNADSNVALNLNAWDSLIIIREVGTTKIYLNGSLANGNVTGEAPKPYAGAFKSLGDPGFTFNGIIADFAAYERVISSSEISMLSNSKLKLLPLQFSSSLKCYLSMDDQSAGTSADGDTVRDLSGNGNNGTGNDGANNTGLQWVGESVLNYPPQPLVWQ